MENHGITIIMAVYNVGHYIEEMLSSIFSQTFKDFEVIIVNDGSSDNTEEIIISYVNKYNNIIYLKQDNKGVSEARNLALSKINKKYVIFFDGDDYIDKSMLKKMYSKAENMEADIVICDYEKVYENKFELKQEVNTFRAEENKVYRNSEIMEAFMDFMLEGYLWNKMFLSQNILKYNMRFEIDRIIEDLFPVFRQISLSERIVFINEPLYKYRQRGTSILHTNNRLKIIEDQHYAYSMMAGLAKRFKSIHKGKYYEFIAFTQASQINKCVNLNIKCNKDIYNKYKIEEFKFGEIFLDSKKTMKVKLKLLLYKFRILHYIYSLKLKEVN